MCLICISYYLLFFPLFLDRLMEGSDAKGAGVRSVQG